MQLAGEIEIAASRRLCWETLADPHKVAECLPGDPRIEDVDERTFRVSVEVGNALMRTTVTADVSITELTPPETIGGSAKASVMASPVSADGAIALEAVNELLTRVTWTLEITLGGMLVGFAPMVQAPLQNGIDQALDCLKSRIEEQAEAVAKG
jgi:carbon monoxide dehydrogenase subunit G